LGYVLAKIGNFLGFWKEKNTKTNFWGKLFWCCVVLF